MVNKRLLELAERQKNRNLPKEKIEKPKESDSKLIQILEKDLEGKPEITLSELEETAVNTPTQEEYNTLMQVYECGSWKWSGGDLPTQINYWDTYKEKTCIFAKNEFKYGDEEYYQKTLRYQVISTQEFYNAQKPPITLEMINEINDWFEKNG